MVENEGENNEIDKKPAVAENVNPSSAALQVVPVVPPVSLWWVWRWEPLDC